MIKYYIDDVNQCEGVMLICKEDVDFKVKNEKIRIINLIQELAKLSYGI